MIVRTEPKRSGVRLYVAAISDGLDLHSVWGCSYLRTCGPGNPPLLTIATRGAEECWVSFLGVTPQEAVALADRIRESALAMMAGGEDAEPVTAGASTGGDAPCCR